MNKIKDTFSAFGQSVAITFRASKQYGVLRLVFSFLLASLPLGSAAIWRRILNELGVGNPVWRLLGIFIAFWGTSQLLRKIDGYIDYKYNDRVNVYLETMFLDKYKDIDLSFYDSSDMQNKIRYVQKIKNSVVGLSSNLFYVLECLLRLFYTFVLLTQLHFGVAPIALLLFLPVIWCQIKINRITTAYDKDSTTISRRSQYFKSLFKNSKNICDIKVFGLQNLFIKRFFDAWDELYRLQKNKTAFSTALLFVGVLFSTVLGQLMLYTLLIGRLIAGTLMIGDVTYYISIFTSFLSAADSLTHSVSYIQYMLDNTKVVREFLALKPEILRSGKADPVFEHDIEFRHVSFKYPGKDNYVLKDCSFRVEKGKTVGLVGLNGAGKSTIVKLLLRLYDVSEGKILLDGVDIRDIEPTAYRRQFGVLFQDFTKYSMTLKENIALSDWYEQEDKEALTRAIEQSQLSEKVKTWSMGFDTPLTRRFEPNGEELSGGQWQRLALARTFFQKKMFYILDEPSASLDVLAEYEIFHQYRPTWSKSGALIISHRLSTIADADYILLLQDGCILEQGSHVDLLSQNGVYADLFLTQAKKYEV